MSGPEYRVNKSTGQVIKDDGTGWKPVASVRNKTTGAILIDEGNGWQPMPGMQSAGKPDPAINLASQRANQAVGLGQKIAKDDLAQLGRPDFSSAAMSRLPAPTMGVEEMNAFDAQRAAEKERLRVPDNDLKERAIIGMNVGTLGFGPYAAAGASTVGALLATPFVQGDVIDREGVSGAMSNFLADARVHQRRAREERPLESFGTEIVGGVLQGKTFIDTLGRKVLPKTNTVSNVGRVVGTGTGYGTLYGLGQSESDTPQGALGDAALGGATGAAFGLGFKAAEPAVTAGYRTAKTGAATISDALSGLLGKAGGARDRAAEEVAVAAVRRSMERSGLTIEQMLELVKRYEGKPAVLAEIIGQDAINSLTALTRRSGTTPQKAQDIITERMGGFAARAADDLRQTTGLTDAQIRGEFGPELAARREAAAPAYTELFEQQGNVTSDRLTQLAGTNTLGPLIRRSQAAAEDLAVTQRRDPASVTPLEVLDLAKRELDDEIATAQRNQQNAELFRLQSLQTALLGELDDLTSGAYAAARNLGGEAPRLQEARTQGERALRPSVTRATVNEQVGALNPQDRPAFASGTASVIDEGIAGGRMLPQQFRLPANREKVQAAFGQEAGGEFANRMTAEAELREMGSRWGPRMNSVTGTVMESGATQMGDDLINAGMDLATGNKVGLVRQAINFMRQRGFSQRQIDAIGDLLLSSPEEGLKRLKMLTPDGAPPPQAPAPRTVGVAPATAAPVGAPAPTTPIRTAGFGIGPNGQATLQQSALGSIGGSAYGSQNDVNGDGVIDEQDAYAGAFAGGVGLPLAAQGLRTVGQPRVTSGRTVGAGLGDNPYFGRQSMRPPGSGPSPREIELRQQWSTATPIVTQARTTAQSAQQAADAALQSKAPADIARAKDAKKTLVSQLQEAQASRAGMDTPEDTRLAETLASLTENTSDPVLLSTQISAAKTSLDRLLTDIGSPSAGNLIPVRTTVQTRTQAPRSAAEGPQDRPSVTRYAEGSDDVQPMGFGADVPKPSVSSEFAERRMRQDILKLESERAAIRGEAQSIEGSLDYGDNYTQQQRNRFGEIDTRTDEIDRLLQDVYRRYGELGYDPSKTLAEDISLMRFVKKPLDQITADDVAEYDLAMAGSPAPKSAEVISFAETLRNKNKPPLKPMGFGAGTPKTPQQAVRFETPGSPEYETAVAKGLDMSQAGRMRRMQEQGYDTPLFHKTDADIEAFDPERGGRGATFFAGSPEGAQAGAGAGQNELRRLFARGDDEASGAPRIMPVVTKSEGIAGLTLAPAQKQYWQSLPEEMPLSDYERLKPDIDKNLGGIPYELYEDSYFVMPDGRKIEARDLKSLSDAEFEAVKQSGKEYLKKGPEPKRTYDEVKRSGRDLYGRQIFQYGVNSNEKAIASRYKAKGHTGYLVQDEGGLTVAIFDPSNIRSVNAAFDPEKSGSSTLLAAAPFAAVSGAGLTLAGEDARNQRTVGKPKTSQSARTVGKAKTN